MLYEFVVDLKPACRRIRPKATSARRDVSILRRSLVLAYQIADYMAANGIKTFKDFSRCADITAPRVTQIMNLLLLSPRIQEEILMEDGPRLHRLRERDLQFLVRETSWARQEELWNGLLARRVVPQ